MKYKLIVIAIDPAGHPVCGADAISTNDPEVEKSYRNKAILDRAGKPSAVRKRLTQDGKCTVEYFSSLNGAGNFAIVTREMDDLQELTLHRIDIRI